MSDGEWQTKHSFSGQCRTTVSLCQPAPAVGWVPNRANSLQYHLTIPRVDKKQTLNTFQQRSNCTCHCVFVCACITRHPCVCVCVCVCVHVTRHPCVCVCVHACHTAPTCVCVCVCEHYIAHFYCCLNVHCCHSHSSLVWSGLVWSGLVWSGVVCHHLKSSALLTKGLQAEGEGVWHVGRGRGYVRGQFSHSSAQ